MIGFWLSEELATSIALPGGEAPKDLHLTVAYFGKLEIPNLDGLLKTLEQFCTNTAPLTGVLSGVGRFNASETSDGMDVVYASFDSPDLLIFRQEVLEIFNGFELQPSTTRGYAPHVTLAYVPSDEEISVKIPTLDVEFRVVTLAVGDTYYDFELLGTSREVDRADSVQPFGHENSVAVPEKLAVASLRASSVQQDGLSLTPESSSATPTIPDARGLATASLSSDQLKLINQFTPEQLEPLQAEEIEIISFIGADNLINRGLGKWGTDELATLAKLLPGLPFTLDHDWGDVSKTQGIIFDARVNKFGVAPEPILTAAGNFDWNRRIVAEEGYITCEFDVAIPSSSPALGGLRFGQLNTVSLGGFNYRDHICPLCKASFSDERCPHLIPEVWMGWTVDTDKRFAPYYVRSGVYDLGEASLVTIPNLPGAGVRRRGNK